MDKSEKLELPYIMPNQAQKHVTHNEAIRQLDALVQISVVSRNFNNESTQPEIGSRYIVAENATGAWASKVNYIAAYQDGAWHFYKPQEGWIVWSQDEASILVFKDNNWQVAQSGSDNLEQVEKLGVNTSASKQSRFGVESNNSFFSHEGNSHRISINKATQEDTSSVIFQTNWTGHAEIGLTGNNDFSFKVTDDGENWVDSIVLSADSGKVSFPSGLENVPLHGVPDNLNAIDLLFVDAAFGDDNNDGRSAVRAIKTLSRLEEILPIGRRVQIRLLSDIIWDHAIRLTYPIASLEIYGRNATNTAYENRSITVIDSANVSGLPGCFQMKSFSNVFLRNINVILNTSKSFAFLNYSATMGYLRTLRVNVSRLGSGRCCLFADGTSFVASRHDVLTIDDSAKGYIAQGVSAEGNPNDDWRYPCNTTSF